MESSASEKEKAVIKEVAHSIAAFGIARLDFAGRGLDRLPAEVLAAPALTKLILRDNAFVAFPAELRKLPSLDVLDLSFNRIRDVAPGDIEALPNLTVVDMSNNSLVAFPFRSLLLLPRLFSLSLGRNYIADFAGGDADVAAKLEEVCVGEIQQFVPSRVASGLYLGAVEATEKKEVLCELGISRILSIGREPAAHHDGVDYHHFAIEDEESEPIEALFEKTTSLIEEALNGGRGVLVHCRMGVSRSTTIVAAFLVSRRRLSVDAALAAIKAVRPQVGPLKAFVDKLRALEQPSAFRAPEAAK
jgi:atypical dual specificity phosphatase